MNLHRTRARVQGAEARAGQALAAWENAVLLALEEVDNALARGREAEARVTDWRRTAGAAVEAARIAQARSDEGLLGPVETLAAERAALQARIAALQAEAELANAGVFVQQALALER